MLLPIEWEPKEGSSELFKKHNKSRRPPNKHKDHPGHRRAAAYQKKRVWLTDRPRCCVCWCCCSWVGAVVVNCSAADDSAYASWWIYSRFGINKKKKLRDKNKQRVSARSCPACRCVYPMKHEPVADPRRPEEIAATQGPLLPSRTRVKLGEIWSFKMVRSSNIGRLLKKKKFFTITRQLLTFFSAEKISRIMKTCLWGPWMSKYMY